MYFKEYKAGQGSKSNERMYKWIGNARCRLKQKKKFDDKQNDLKKITEVSLK